LHQDGDVLVSGESNVVAQKAGDSGAAVEEFGPSSRAAEVVDRESVWVARCKFKMVGCFLGGPSRGGISVIKIVGKKFIGQRFVYLPPRI
jgi:hypothetical protein